MGVETWIVDYYAGRHLRIEGNQYIQVVIIVIVIVIVVEAIYINQFIISFCYIFLKVFHH